MSSAGNGHATLGSSIEGSGLGLERRPAPNTPLRPRPAAHHESLAAANAAGDLDVSGAFHATYLTLDEDFEKTYRYAVVTVEKEVAPVAHRGSGLSILCVDREFHVDTIAALGTLQRPQLGRVVFHGRPHAFSLEAAGVNAVCSSYGTASTRSLHSRQVTDILFGPSVIVGLRA